MFRLTLRTRLILTITLPLLVTYIAMLAWDWRIQRDEALTRARAQIAERASSAAAGFEARLDGVRQLAEGVANVLEARPVILDMQIQNLLRASMRPGSPVFAVWIAWEPDVRKPGLSAELVRRGMGPRTIDLARLVDYTQPDIAWYAQVKLARKGLWLPPARAPHTGELMLHCYSTPIIKDDQFKGVVVAALREADLRAMLAPGIATGELDAISRPNLDARGPEGRNPEGRSPDGRGPDGRSPDGRGPEGRGPGFGPATRDAPGERFRDFLDRRNPPAPDTPPPTTLPQRAAPTTASATAEASDFIILDAALDVVSHPDPARIGQPSIFTAMQAAGRNDIDPIAAQLLTDAAGVVELTDPPSGHINTTGDHRLVWIAFARIPSTQWVLTVGIPPERVLDPVMQQLAHRAGFLLAGLAVIVLVLLLATIRFTRPIEQLARAVRKLGEGTLDVEMAPVRGNDEIAQLARSFDSMTRQLRHHVELLTRESAARAKVDSELRIARQIQTDLLPSTFPPFPDRREFDLHATNVAAREVAGDFYDFFFTPSGELALVIADVSGKGIPAALLMAVTRTIIRNLVNAGLTPAAVMERTNQTLFEDSGSTLFVTAFLALYQPADGQLIYSNAGHPPPWLLQRSGALAPFGEVTGPLLGVCAHGELGPYEQRTARLDIGQTLLLFTDGLTDARTPDGRMVSPQALERMLARIASRTPRQVCEGIVGALRKFQADVPYDDLTLLAIRRAI